MEFDKHYLAKKFIETWQLNVPERRSLEGQPIAGSLLVDAIVELLRAHGWYPLDWRPDNGFDGGLIELVSSECCRVYWKVEAGVGRFELIKVQTFDTLAVGVAEYGTKFFGQHFDGIPIDWSQ